MRTARLAGLWFGIQAVWAAILGVVLQDRAIAVAPDAVGTYAVIAAVGAIVAALVQLAAGVASDRLRTRTGDRRVFYAAGVTLAVPALIALPGVTSLGWLWAASLVLQVGMNLAAGPYQAVVSDYVDPEHVGRASSWMSSFQFCGSVAGLVLTTLLHGVALGVALAACLVGGWALTDWQARRSTPVARTTTPLRLDRNARTVIAARAAINVGFYTLFGFLLFFVRDSLGVADPTTTTGILFLVFTIAGVGGAALAGRPADRFDKRVVVTIAGAAIVVAVGAFALALNVPVALVCALGAGLAWGAYFTADWALAYAVLPRGALAAAMGVWNLAAALPQIVAPAITAPLVVALSAHQRGLGPRAALGCVIVEFAIGTAWLWRLPRVVT